MTDKTFFAGDIEYWLTEKDNISSETKTFVWSEQWEDIRLKGKEFDVENEKLVLLEAPCELGGGGSPNELLFILGSFVFSSISSGITYDFVKNCVSQKIILFKSKINKAVGKHFESRAPIIRLQVSKKVSEESIMDMSISIEIWESDETICRVVADFLDTCQKI